MGTGAAPDGADGNGTAGEDGRGGSASGSVAPDTLLEVDSARVARRLGGGEEWKTDFSRILVPPGEIRSGGPPKDGIPSIDDPTFVDVSSADGWLEPREPVMVVRREGRVKAYPLRILIYHEIVNDRIAGLPVAVTYCPLCNTALVFDRRLDGGPVEFGTTGRLRNSDLVMYDRRNETWWQQATGRAIVGELAGRRLEFLPSTMLSWEKVKELHPGARVLSRETGHGRDYGRNPYAGYEERGPIPTFAPTGSDGRLPAMERVVTLPAVEEGWAAPHGLLRERRVANVRPDGEPLVVFWEPGQSSAVDAGRVAGGRDVGQTAVFRREADARTLTFEWREGAFTDRETGSRWNLAGEAVAGPLEGTSLEAVPHGDHFWFAWVAFRPETRLWDPEG